MKSLILMGLVACVVMLMTWTVDAQQKSLPNHEGTEFRTSDVGCLNAKPLLGYDSDANSYYLLSCSERIPCPINNYYCSIEGRQSIEGRVCCPANRAISKTGSCPAPTKLNIADCVDACLSDGDCSSNKKCCRQSMFCTKKMCRDVLD